MVFSLVGCVYLFDVHLIRICGQGQQVLLLPLDTHVREDLTQVAATAGAVGRQDEVVVVVTLTRGPA